jgi:hypothetical protein
MFSAMRGAVLAALAMMTLGGAAQARDEAPTPTDYSQDANWLCRPGRQDACATNLDAMAYDAKGAKTAQPFVAATDPAIDCFYVYPTVSRQASTYSDLKPDASEINVAQVQAARFRAKCRVFAPMYRQVTLAGLNASFKPGAAPVDFSTPYADVRDAWRAYLAHDNHGRGVVLIGHSQGSILLTRLIAEEIDAKPIARQLVSALLPGDIGLLVPVGKDVGGTFKATPLCRAPTQTGCVLVWNTYAEDDASFPRFFGVSHVPGMVAACVNPAALAGGSGLLDAYLHKPSIAPANDPPWVEVVGQLSAECRHDPAGDVLRVRVEPGPNAALLKIVLTRSTLGDGWGLHILDPNLPMGNLVELVGTQGAAWVAGRR